MFLFKDENGNTKPMCGRAHNQEYFGTENVSQGHFEKRFMRDIQRKGPAWKNIIRKMERYQRDNP